MVLYVYLSRAAVCRMSECCTSCSLIADTLATSASVEAEKYRSVVFELFWSYLGSTVWIITFQNRPWEEGRNSAAYQ